MKIIRFLSDCKYEGQEIIFFFEQTDVIRSVTQYLNNFSEDTKLLFLLYNTSKRFCKIITEVLYVLGFFDIEVYLSKEKPTCCHLFYYLFNTHSMLNMFRPLIRPSSGVCD